MVMYLVKNMQDFNSRTPRGVRRGGMIHAPPIYRISTHAPHAECDILQLICTIGMEISTHAPHAECDGKK